MSLYRRAFAEYGPRALWNMRPIDDPTAADALAITKALRTYGGMEGRLAGEVRVKASPAEPRRGCDIADAHRSIPAVPEEPLTNPHQRGAPVFLHPFSSVSTGRISRPNIRFSPAPDSPGSPQGFYPAPILPVLQPSASLSVDRRGRSQESPFRVWKHP